MESVMAHRRGNPGGTVAPEEHNKELICLSLSALMWMYFIKREIANNSKYYEFRGCTEMMVMTENVPLFQSNNPDMKFDLPAIQNQHGCK